MGVVECFALPETDMTGVQRSTSFRGPPEHVWTYIIDVEEFGFQPPMIVMIAII